MNYNTLIAIQQQIKNLQEKAKKLETALYDEIYRIYREVGNRISKGK